jgi:hypothetical protein
MVAVATRRPEGSAKRDAPNSWTMKTDVAEGERANAVSNVGGGLDSSEASVRRGLSPERL